MIALDVRPSFRGGHKGSSLYFYRLRFYDSQVGRFVSRDPLGAWGDAAQMGVEQGYCGNNPVNRVDPFGLDQAGSPKQDDASGGGGGASRSFAGGGGGASRSFATNGDVADTWAEGAGGHMLDVALEFGAGVGEAAIGMGEFLWSVANMPRNFVMRVVEAEATIAFSVLQGVPLGQALEVTGSELAGEVIEFGTRGPRGLWQFGSDIVDGLQGNAREGGRAVFGLVLILVGPKGGTATPEMAGTGTTGMRILTETPHPTMRAQVTQWSCCRAVGVEILRRLGFNPRGSLFRVAEGWGMAADDVAAAMRRVDSESGWSGGIVGGDPMAFALSQNGEWIAFVKGSKGSHAIIIESIADNIVTFTDPWGLKGFGRGRRASTCTVTLQDFYYHWTRALNNAVWRGP